jgi:hypothetical protein
MSVADYIDTLPVDESTLTQTEMQMLNGIFKEQQTAVQKILSQTQDITLAGLLFLAFSTPQAEDVIKRFFPSTTTSPYILLAVKTMAFMIVYFAIKNMYLVRKAN